MLYVKSLKRQIYSVEDHIKFYGITRYDPGTVDLLAKLVKVTKDYDLLSSKQKEIIG